MSQLKLSDWSNVAEIVGTLVVIVTLVFVGLQVRQNTLAVESAAAQAVHENFAGWYTSLQSEPVLFEISVKGMQNYSSLNEVEKAQFIAMFMAFCSHSQNAYYKWKDGSLSLELWRGWKLVSMNFFSTSGGKAFWIERGYLFGAGFRSYIEGEVLTAKPHSQAKPWGAFKIDQ